MKRKIKPRTGLMKKYMDLAHKLAWDYHKKSRIDFEELKSAAYTGLAEAVAAWNPERGAISTVAYKSIWNELIDYGAAHYKHMPLSDGREEVELAGRMADPANVAEFRSSLLSLSAEAQDVCRVIFESPAEILGIGGGMQGCRKAVVERLGGKWSEATIRAAFVEIKEIL